MGGSIGPQTSPQTLLLFRPGNHRITRSTSTGSCDPPPNDREQFTVGHHFHLNVAALDYLRAHWSVVDDGLNPENPDGNNRAKHGKA